MNQDPQSAAEMSFWDHLEALRRVIIRALAVVALISCAFFAVMPDMFDAVILAPCSSRFILYRWLCSLSQRFPMLPDMCSDTFEVHLVNYELNSQFFIHMSTSFWLGLVVSFPVVIYQMWSFVSPALYEHEKRHARLAFLAGNVLFYLGVVVGYLTVFPMALRFLSTYQVSQIVANQISLSSYMDNFLSMIFMMGVVFELPLLCWMLSSIGVLHRSFFATYRRHAIVVLLIVAAIITPADPFSMLVLFFPLYLLYEASALIVKK
jgi:sec-independent protein translocase protein TatC